MVSKLEDPKLSSEAVSGSRLWTPSPRIAGLLTLLGWGSGLFYAGRMRLAIIAGVAQVGHAMVFVFCLVGLIAIRHPAAKPLWKTVQDGAHEWVGFALSAALGVCVFLVTRRPQATKLSRRTRAFGAVGFWLAPLMFSVAVALVVRSIAIQPFNMASGAMQPTISPNTLLLVNKHKYGHGRYSYKPLPGPLRTELPHDIVGDVVAFHDTATRATWVSRVVAIEGDTVTVRGGQLSVNGRIVEREVIGETKGRRSVRSDEEVPVQLYRETLSNGVSFRVWDFEPTARFDYFGPYTVPDGHVFLMSDNRDFSVDSRSPDLGPVSIQQLLGPIAVISK